jgi:SAM-dependent methyltransferase
MTSRMSTIAAQVISGRGHARALFEQILEEIPLVAGERVIPGTLNLLLKKPLMFNNDRALRLRNGSSLLLLWPGEINGKAVWLYRWGSAPLHVVEVISNTKLREYFNLVDGDRVTVSIGCNYVSKISYLGRVAWTLCWLGRKKWSYKNDKYYEATHSFCTRSGATQLGLNDTTFNVVVSPMKSLIRRIPGARRVIAHVRKSERRQPAISFSRELYRNDDAPEDIARRQLQNILNYTKTSGSEYSAIKYPAGYHSIDIFGKRLAGQRDPSTRLSKVPFDFGGKTVLDIGTNQGGMLFAINEEIKDGVGIDYDPRMINAANRIKAWKNAHNLQFYVVNVENEPLDLILDLVPGGQVDIVLLLSVCMWISNWKELVEFCAKNANHMLFESNGTDNQQLEQEKVIHKHYTSVKLLSNLSDDDPGQRKRRLFLCRNS